MSDHSLLQGGCRIADIILTGLTLSLGTYILVYEVIFTWVIERIVLDENVAELPIIVF